VQKGLHSRSKGNSSSSSSSRPATPSALLGEVAPQRLVQLTLVQQASSVGLMGRTLPRPRKSCRTVTHK
jgi:hypothetical protein